MYNTLGGRAAKNEETRHMNDPSDGHQVDMGGRGPDSNNTLGFIIELYR